MEKAKGGVNGGVREEGVVDGERCVGRKERWDGSEEGDTSFHD